MKLEDQTAIIIGGLGGIGKAITETLLASGLFVFFTYLPVEAEQANQFVESHPDYMNKLLGIVLDITNEIEVSRFFDHVLSKTGRIDVLVNCAGISIDGLISTFELSDFIKIQMVNLVGPFLTMKYAVRSMIRQGYGRIVNIGSIVGIKGLRGGLAYAASKAGLIGLSRSIAKETARKGITVNVISPGYIDAGLGKAVPENYIKSILDLSPISRLGSPEEIANGVLYLISPGSEFITGIDLVIDGGYSM